MYANHPEPWDVHAMRRQKTDHRRSGWVATNRPIYTPGGGVTSTHAYSV